MKKMTKMVLLMLMIVASVFAITACDDNPSNVQNGQISVEQSGMPQTVFVLGEELDLSNGVLTVKNGDQTEEIALNAEGITVTGYDKNKLGEQTITITYGGNSTELKITVVERMQMVEHVTDYLVGDALDTSVGRLKITRNDGSNYTVLLGSDGVEISGFDSSKTGAQNVTVKYTGNGVDYTCQFTVNVHAVENVEFHAPKKLNYNSHDSGLDLTDGYFTLSGNNGKLTKNVVLTEDMVSGFDLTAVSQENSPLTQNLTVSYNGQSYQYDIQLVYTNISLFQKEADAFAVLDWSNGNIPEISAELGEKALELMEIYLDLSKADQTRIDREMALTVARTALMYGVEQMDADFVALEGAFTITGGALEFTCESREDVERAVEILDNEDGEIYRISPVLVALTEEFADEEVITDMYFGDFGLLPVEIYEELLDMFEHMLDAHDVLMDIPDDWQTVGVQTYAGEIEAFYDVIFGSDYVDSGMSYIYGYVSNWRTTGDAFDILYQYYYEMENAEALNALATVNLPTCLSELAYHVTEMLSQVDMISNYAQMDTTLLMYHYYTAQRLAAELKDGDDVMAKNLYEVLPVNALMGLSDSTLFYFDTLLEYIKTMEGGYYQYSGGLLGLQTYHDLMDAYMALITNILEDDTYQYSDRYNADLEALFNRFVELKPTEQYYFLNTLNAFYSMSVPPMAFDDTGDAAELMCLFVKLVHEYYRDKLSSNAVTAYNDLMIALEIYAQRMNRENWVSEFTGRMESVETIYNGMNADDKAAFDKYLGAIYGKYMDIRDTYVLADDLIDLGEWEDEFDALDDAVLSVEIALSAIQQGQPCYGLFFSAYERAQELSNYILTNAPAEIVEAYYYEARYGAYDAEAGMGTETVAATYEYVLTTYRNMYVNYLLSALGYSVYDVYVDSPLPAFMNDCYDLCWTFIYDGEYDNAKVLGILKTFRELTLEDQILFVLLEGENGYYYTALDEFLTLNYTENARAAAMKLVALEEQYILYNYYAQNEGDLNEVLPDMQTVLDDAKAAYEALSAEDKAAFADFEEMYTYYVTLCEQALAANAA